MQTTYYIKDANGALLSTDRKTAFTALQGKAAYEYLNSEEGRGKHFFRYKDDHGNTIAIEVDEELFRRYNREQKAQAYRERCNQESGKTVISLDSQIEDLMFVECIADESVNIEIEYEEQETLEAMRHSVSLLSLAEQDMIAQLYLRDEPLTEREYAGLQGLSQTTVNYRKRRALDKLHGMIA